MRRAGQEGRAQSAFCHCLIAQAMGSSPTLRFRSTRPARREFRQLCRGLRIQRMPPAEAGKPCKPMIHRDPLTTGFQSECRVVGVGDQVAPRIDLATQRGENPPVCRPRLKKMNLVARSEVLQKLESLRKRRRFPKNLGMGNDTKEPAQNEIGNRQPSRSDISAQALSSA